MKYGCETKKDFASSSILISLDYADALKDFV